MRDRSIVRLLAGLALVVAFTVGLAPLPTSAAAEADANPADETERWVPAIGAVWGLMLQDSRALSRGSELTGSSPSEPVRLTTAGSETMFNPFVGGSFELMTPKLLYPIGRPRAFARVDLSGALGFEYEVSKERRPGPMIPPTLPTPESAVVGQGSTTSAKVDPFVVNAAAGVAFTLDVGDRRARIKPSFEYMREKVHLTGLMNRAVALDGRPSFPSLDYRYISLGAEDSRIYHLVGAGLELELDAVRRNSVTAAVFLGVQGYAVLDNDVVVLRDSFTDSVGTESAEWFFRKEAWVVRVSMGLRFRWAPN
jgi:hypothetical protein